MSSAAAPANAYLQRTLRLDCAVQDTAYVVYNLYMQGLRRRQEGARPPATTAPPEPAPVREIGPPQPPATATRAASDSMAGAVVGGGAGSVVAGCGSVAEGVLLPMLRAVVELEQLPLGDKAQRASYAQTAAAFPQPAAALLAALAALNGVVRAVCGAALPPRQAPRSARIGLQATVRDRLAEMKRCRTALESLLDDINDSADDDETPDEAREAVYTLCGELHSDLVMPRVAVAEALLCSQTALALRTPDLVQYARRFVCKAFPVASKAAVGSLCFGPLLQGQFADSVGAWAAEGEDDDACVQLAWLTDAAVDGAEEAMVQAHAAAADAEATAEEDGEPQQEVERRALMAMRVLLQEVPHASRALLDAVSALASYYSLLQALDPDSVHDVNDVGPEMDAVCDRLLACGVVDAEMWLSDHLRAFVGRKAKGQEVPLGQSTVQSPATQSVRRSMSFSTTQLAMSGTLTPNKRQHMPSVRGDADCSDRSDADDEDVLMATISTQSAEELFRRLDAAMAAPDPTSTRESVAAASRLYDVLGRVNMFLRRCGLASEVRRAEDGAKVVPTAADGPRVYLEHTTDDALGFAARESVLYEQACLRYERMVQQNTVGSTLDELDAATDDDFFRACHSDLLAGLLARADEHCVVTEARRGVERRLDRLLVLRVKAFHHGGEVRVMTVPQRSTLAAVTARLAEHWPDMPACDVHFLDDGDKVRISTDRELEELIRVRRALVLDGMGLGASLGRSLVSSTELKLELYVDRRQPQQRTSQAPPPQGRTDPPPRRPASSAVGALPPAATAVAKRAPPPADPPTNKPLLPLRAAPPDVLGERPAPAPAMSMSALIRRQEALERAAEAAMRPPSSHVPDAEDASGRSLVAFFDRKMAEKGLLLPGESQPLKPALPAPPRGPGIQLSAPPALVDGRTHHTTSTSVGLDAGPPAGQPSARGLFLAMGRAKREGRDQSGAQGPAPLQHGPVSSTPNPRPSTLQPQVNVVRAPENPAASVVVVEAAGARWRMPPSDRPLCFAQHLGQSTADADPASSGSDDDVDALIADPTWDRRSENHVQEVLCGEGRPPPPRHNGPLRRGGVPLPQDARRRK